jgi:hypothetical protein
MDITLPKLSFLLVLGMVLVSAGGCVSTQERLLDSDTSQLLLRSFQSRAFETSQRTEIALKSRFTI